MTQSDPTKSTTASSILDEKTLDKLRAMRKPDRPDVLVKLITLYLDNTPGLLETMQKAIHSQDHASLKLAAHTLKTSCLNVGAGKLSSLCKDMEVMQCEDSTDDARGLLSEIQSGYKQVEKELERIKVLDESSSENSE